MDHTRDNPLKRFTAFWIALLLVSSFGVACIILRPLTHVKAESAYEKMSEQRLTVRSSIERAQRGALNQEKLNEAIQGQIKTLNKKPSAGSMPVPDAAPAAAAETPPAS